MKKTIFFFMVILMSCSSEVGVKYTLTNLSGVNWYTTTIYYANSENGASLRSKDVGTLKIGESAEFQTDCSYFHVGARDGVGVVVLSRTKTLSATSINVTKDDLY